LLVTSKGTKRWIVPKGYLEPGLTARESAEFEAFEEAGVAGPVERSSIGAYTYRKRKDRGGFLHRVRVYPMRVSQTFDDYPEADLREREWMPVDEAIERAEDSGLKKLLSQFSQRTAAALD
jgi:8-oxo-dGTP pyrophosphatase MutT (NUDIX family)